MVAALQFDVDKEGLWYGGPVHWNFLRCQRLLQRLELKGCYACSSDGARPREQKPVHSYRVHFTRGLERFQGTSLVS